jgi:hypothetical protein
MIDLRYDMIGADYAGEKRHPQDVMKALGIHYIHATPQSIGDCWWFWCCDLHATPKSIGSNPLPSFIEPIDLSDAFKYVGWGISKETAAMIESYRKT